MPRHYSLFDRLAMQADAALRTLVPDSNSTARPSPALNDPESQLDDKQRKHVTGLMRINHTGEVCAQGLYQGQALTAHRPEIRDAMEQAADEEIDHLVWCEQRIKELGGRTSLLNPLFYGMSFAIGAGAGAISDKLSLGFVAATEDQVCKHLDEHLGQLPADEHKSRAILEQMYIDEQEHSTNAIAAGGYRFPAPVKAGMSLIAKAMTTTTYRI